MQYVEDSFVEEREIRSCHWQIGRSCYHHGHRACPVPSYRQPFDAIVIAQAKSKTSRTPWILDTRATYLAWVDLITAEGIVVGTHLDG
jgi:hypothetical protein